MNISGFSYVRNGFEYGCPFIQAIQSILPICNEFIVAVGNSTDGTREAIEALASPKIKIVDTTWNMNLTKGGKIFAQQSNLALDHVTGKWAFHVQADEVIHEQSLPIIMDALTAYDNDQRVDGFILPFLHFWGDFNHIRNSRRVHRYEVRIFRNDKIVRSYKDSQGFRKYASLQDYNTDEELGEKLNVKKIDAPVYHYNGVRSSKSMAKKSNNFLSFYGEKEYSETPIATFEDSQDLRFIDRVVAFTKSHPAVMKSFIEGNDFVFVPDKSKAVWHKYDKYIQPLEDLLGFKFGEYKNYNLI
jgi:glycosyltransferase involved in cell wall biosynthesis